MIRMEGQIETRNSKKTKKRKVMDEEDNEKKKDKAMESQRLSF